MNEADDLFCDFCGAEKLLGVCPSCPVDPTIPIPQSVLDGFLDSTRPPAITEDDEIPPSVPTRPASPNALHKSEPPKSNQ